VRRFCRGLLLFATLGLTAHSARAQLGASTGTGNNLNIEHYVPAPLGLSTADTSKSQRWGEYSVGLFVHYARNPLVLFADRLQVGEVVGHRISTDFVGTLGLLKWLEAGVALPVTYWQTGDPDLPTGDISGGGFRDIRAQLKATLATQDRTGLLGIALVPALSIPIGDDTRFLGDGNFVFSPHVVIDRSLDVLFGLRASLTGGVRIRPRTEIGNIEIDDEIFYRLGVGVGLPNLWDKHPEVIAEVAGTTRLNDPFNDVEQNALQGTLAMRATFDLEPGHRILGIAGVNIGGTRGYGSPDAQIFLGAVYQRYLSDRDRDGIVDDEDSCPDNPEDFDDFEDEDGCPEPDNDKDGLPDVSDRCPDEPEDLDHFEDLDGCPEPDNDRDGLMDKVDKCPNEPEDIDGFEDSDGCPDPDNDRDGIPDDKDKCPDGREVINGVDDEDGCPDDGDTHVEVTSEKVTIDTKIMFDFDSARIRPESFNILNQVALTLQANMQLKKIRVEGHTDERGSDVYNLNLSQKRAESVMAYLVGRGVKEERIEAVGYGETKPVVDGHDEEAWSKNRRVEFTILEQEGVESTGRTLEIPK
jgi:outer membrane protein OmpA-like peptidoglycan-associated protein